MEKSLLKITRELNVNPIALFIIYLFMMLKCDVISSHESCQLEMSVLLETNKQLNQSWLTNRYLLNSIDAYKIQPRLNLYSKIDKDNIDKITKVCEEIQIQIDFSNKIRNQLVNLKVSPLQISEIDLQILELRIALGFQKCLLNRKQHNFPMALKVVKECFELIDVYKTLCEKAKIEEPESIKSLLCLAFYHKAKVHRMLAGYDLNSLKLEELKLCEESYLAALENSLDHPIILSSLGFLYNDMQEHEKALVYHLQVDKLCPHFPDFVHGVANGYYYLEQKKAAHSTPLNLKNLNISEEAYKQAIELFKEYQTENSRVFYDYGKLKLLTGEPDEALHQFNNGLEIEPNHPLLLMERGLLLIEMEKSKEGLADLLKGHIYHRGKALFEMQYIQAMEQDSKQNSFADNSEYKKVDDETFDSILRQCADYALKYNGNITPKSCFISYAWNQPEHEAWVEKLAENLEKAGFNVLLDRWYTRKGEDTMNFIEKIAADELDYILVVGTKLYLEKYHYEAKDLHDRERVLKIEARLLNHMIGYNEIKSNKVIPILLEGTPNESLPPFMHPKNIVDFTKECYYSAFLELIRDMHKIDQRDYFFKQLLNKYKYSKPTPK